MQDYNYILAKVNQFTKKHYTQVLLRGLFLFIAFGLLFFLFIIGIEYFLWMNTTGRFILFGIFILIEGFLLFRYILTPVFFLFRIKKGISQKEAAAMIGKHFPEVDDKLINLFELAENQSKSELLLASITQRSKALHAIPFSKAVNFKEALKYTKYAIIPICILGLIYISGNWSSFFGTYDRVVNYRLAYEKPAPFQFDLLTKNLNVLEDKAITLHVVTKGNVKPENVYINIEGKEILLPFEKGLYSYTFLPPLKNSSFYFTANEVTSPIYSLNSLTTPYIMDFSLELNYPSYLGKKNEVIKGTGNATIPEGTKVSWNIVSQNTEKINLKYKDTSIALQSNNNQFKTSKRVHANLNYKLSTSNENVEEYEQLSYSLNVIKDGHPTIEVKQVLDSINPNISYYLGKATDDHGLDNITLVYYQSNSEQNSKSIEISRPQKNFEQFYYTFPSGLELEAGKNYSFYFQATDNDAIHSGKTVKTQVFQQTILNEDQLRNKDLKSQQSLIKNLDKSLKQVKDQKESLDELNQNQKEKRSLNFEDQNQIKDFLKKQEQQEQQMQKFSKELKENLKRSNQDDKLNQLLQERLERQELEAKKNEKLLEELNKIADKINKEELKKKLEELAKKQQNSERSLEQLLELTKRYYVTEKASQLAKELEELAKEQEELSLKKDLENNPESQEELNKKFDALEEQLDMLKEDNKALKKPIDLKINNDKKEGVQQDQDDALDALKKEQNSNQDKNTPAQKKQKSAADKMKEMSKELSSSTAGGGGGSSITEDAEMLRQILDNLIIFSFKQENLYDRLSAQKDYDATQYSKTVKDQNELRGLFEHVDDSLFALSLRQAELSEFVNEQITEVYYNIDKSLETMADGQVYQGISHQKYVLTAANSLADFLAEVMDNMQQNMQMGKGSGGSDFQLPDIIEGQESIGQKMNGKKGAEGKGKDGKSGEGQQGKSGEKGKDGQGGKQGKDGKEGSGNKEGKGKDGQGGQNGQGNNNGQNSSGQSSSGNGQGQMSEQELKEIYEIYQNQQKIRQALEEQLNNMINNGDQKLGEKLVRQMEDFENDLLENGITQRTINKANNIQYELLKLENAALKQGKKSERESNTNLENFTNPIITKPSLLDNYRNEVEILNRQSLPLRQNFKTKVKEYFKAHDKLQLSN
ncbi:hypothetical protein [Maribacter sp. LLG6340-A2]|uniref:hypothetical protein n=1 Tax=Maribacter sp. LLG6340-A2 TaxID=3160834 RepID=UPI003869FBCF